MKTINMGTGNNLQAWRHFDIKTSIPQLLFANICTSMENSQMITSSAKVIPTGYGYESNKFFPKIDMYCVY